MFIKASVPSVRAGRDLQIKFWRNKYPSCYNGCGIIARHPRNGANMAGRKKQDQSTRRRRPVIRGVVVFLLFIPDGRFVSLACRSACCLDRPGRGFWNSIGLPTRSRDCVIVPGAWFWTTASPAPCCVPGWIWRSKYITPAQPIESWCPVITAKKIMTKSASWRITWLRPASRDAHVFMDHAGFDAYNTVYRAQSVSVSDAPSLPRKIFIFSAPHILAKLGLDL